MRRRVLPLLSVVPALALVTSMSGCGITDNGPRLDVAAELDGQTLALSRIDDVLTDYCALISRHPDTEQARPRAWLRGQLLLGWAQTVAVRDLGEKYDVTVASEADVDRAAVVAGWGEDGVIRGDEFDSFQWLEWLNESAAAVQTIGTKHVIETTGTPPTDQLQVQEAGRMVIAQWMAEQEIVVNPVFGSVDLATGAFSPDTLTVPVGDDTTDLGPDATDAQLAALPDAERCGAKPNVAATDQPAQPAQPG